MLKNGIVMLAENFSKFIVKMISLNGGYNALGEINLINKVIRRPIVNRGVES